MCQLYSHHHVPNANPQQTMPAAAAAAAASSSKKDQSDRTTRVTVLPRPPADVDALIGTRKNHFFTEKVIDAFVSDAQQTLISVRTRGRFCSSFLTCLDISCCYDYFRKVGDVLLVQC